MRQRSRSGTWPWETPPGRDQGYRRRWRQLHATGPLYTSVRPNEPRPEDRTDRCPRTPDTAGLRDLPTPHVSMRPTRRFASGTAAMGLYFTGFAGPGVTPKYMSRN